MKWSWNSCEEDGQSCEQFTTRRGRWFTEACGWCFASDFPRSWLSISVIYNTISTCVCLHPKISGCCIFVVPLQMHAWSREWFSQPVFTLSTVLSSHAHGAGQGMCHCVKPILRKQTVPYAHDNHNLHIKCFLCGAFLKSLLQFFVQLYSFFLWMKNNSVGTNDDAV